MVLLSFFYSTFTQNCLACLFSCTLRCRCHAEMEGAKEKMRQERGEKDSNEAEDGRRSDDNDEEDEDDSEVTALVWQEGYDEDNLSLPIMHWEALSLRIAELEKQEELKKEQKAMVGILKSQRHTLKTFFISYHSHFCHISLLTCRFSFVVCYFTSRVSNLWPTDQKRPSKVFFSA